MKFYTVIFVTITFIILIIDYFLYKKSEKRIFIKKVIFFAPTLFFLASYTFIKLFAERITDYRINIVLMWFNFIFIIIYMLRGLQLARILLPKGKLKRISENRKTKYLFYIIFTLTIVYITLITPFKPIVTVENLAFSNLPEAFRGYKIVQISDAHLGSKPFSKQYYSKIADVINQQNPDMVVFTGDMVNNFAEEMIGFDTIFNRIKAKDGKFAVLGNHDYGDYAVWASEKDKIVNLQKIKREFANFGFQLLNNVHITLHREDEQMELIGVENYHKNPSKNYSDLSTATNNLNPNSFKILLSHNPLHWDNEVSSKTDIELTLSGHTHAGQMGVELFNKVISPVVVVYPKYNGIYRNEDQILYINRGIGYIGLPITFGLNPQISVIQLDKK